MRALSFNFVLGFVSIFSVSSVVSGAEHPSEHPSEHPAKSGKSDAVRAEHPEHPTARKKTVTKAEISAGIRSHIKAGAKAAGGKYRLDYGDQELALTLLKVHDDKLATLRHGTYFACTDLTGSDGNTYDVDFFLSGKPGAMDVTESMVHKVNGKPLYRWKQEAEGHWTRVSKKD